jgi:hypothetical protein
MAGLPAPERLAGPAVQKAEVENGAIHMYYFENTFPEPQGEQILSVRPVFPVAQEAAPAAAAPVWTCANEPPLPGMQYAGENKTTISYIYLPLGVCR